MTNFQFSTRHRSSKPTSPAGKAFLSLIFLLFLASGVVVAWSLGKQIFKSLETRGWQPTQCAIVSGKIPEKSPYAAVVTYKYANCGVMYQSSVIRTGYNGTQDYYDAQKILDAYPPGGSAMCRINPSNPAEAVLATPSISIVFQLLFPMLFIAAGGCGAFFIWRPPKITPPAIHRHPRVGQAVFFAIFFIAGVVLLAVMASTYTRYQSAQSWPKIPCRIVSSSVASRSSRSRHGNRTTYSVDVLFRYSFNQKRHESSRYALVHISDSGYADKRKIVDNLTQHRSQYCYVNPLDPADAVLDRNGHSTLIITGIIGIVMLSIGGGGLGFVVHSVRREHRSRLQDQLSPGVSGPAELHPASSPLSQFLVVCLIALFCNGIISVFVVDDVQGWQRGHGDIFLTIFLIPFLLFGTGLLIAAIYGIGKLFLPTAQLAVSRQPLAIGEDAELHWQIVAGPGQVTRLQIRIALFEVTADPQAGRFSLSSLTPVWTQEVIDTNRNLDITSGRKSFNIAAMPVKLNPAFKLIWAIIVVEAFQNAKKLQQEFPFNVVTDRLEPIA